MQHIFNSCPTLLHFSNLNTLSDIYPGNFQMSFFVSFKAQIRIWCHVSSRLFLTYCLRRNTESLFKFLQHMLIDLGLVTCWYTSEILEAIEAPMSMSWSVHDNLDFPNEPMADLLHICVWVATQCIRDKGLKVGTDWFVSILTLDSSLLSVDT